MNNYERTIDLIHVFNYVKYHLKNIIKVTISVSVIVILLVVAKNIILPSEEMYYSTSKILFKFNSWSTTEKDYSFENWNLNGSEQYKSDSNWDFLSNAKYVFASDKILADVLDENNIDKELAEFKKDVIVDVVPGTHMIRVVVQAKTPELAESILKSVVEDGIESVKTLYDLRYEVIDEYTDYENSFNDLEIKSDGTIEISSNIIGNFKIVMIATVGILLLMCVYYGLKCIFNNNVESVDMIEKAFEIPVLQVLDKVSKNYDITATKLINRGVKTILFTSIKKDELIGEDIVIIAKKLVERNKKTLIVCVDSKESIKFVGLNNSDEQISSIDGVDFVSTSINKYSETIDKHMEGYDFVLIETSSMDKNSDSLLISKSAEYTVLVSVCDSISVDKYNQKIKDFKMYSSGVDGVILKEVNRYSSSYKYIQVNYKD